MEYFIWNPNKNLLAAAKNAVFALRRFALLNLLAG
jgi:hypothetical protein